jgi:hypothetical protein
MKVIIYILILSYSFIALAHKFEANNMLVDHPWMKVFNKNGAGYFKITNTGKKDIHLIKVVSDNVANIELHTVIMDEGVAKMRPIKDGVIIKVGESMEFKPMGYHLMFFGINKKFDEGELLEVNFKFKKENNLLVKFKVESKKSSHDHEH